MRALINRLGSLRFALTVITAITALYFILVVFGNVTDFDTNRQFVHHVLAMDTTFQDEDVMWRAITNPVVADIGYVAVIIWEALTGAVLVAACVAWLKAVFGSARSAMARKLSTLGWIMAVTLFAGGFITIGGEWFAMWQSQDWNGLQPATQNFLIAAVGLLLVNLPAAEDAPRTEPERTPDGAPY